MSIADLVYVISGGRVLESGSPDQLRSSDSESTRQFIDGLPDGPVAFHYPSPGLEADLFGEPT